MRLRRDLVGIWGEWCGDFVGCVVWPSCMTGSHMYLSIITICTIFHILGVSLCCLAFHNLSSVIDQMDLFVVIVSFLLHQQNQKNTYFT